MLNVTDIPFDDAKTYELLGSGHTIGCFQLESPLGRHWCKRAKPTSVEHISALVAILRPGCISGDTKITTYLCENTASRNKHFIKVSMRDLYHDFQHGKNKRLVSLNENTNLLERNNIEDVVYSGIKKVYKPFFKSLDRSERWTSNKFHTLECTDDHKLLTHDRGWVALKDLQIGERVAVVSRFSIKSRHTRRAPGQSHFRYICFQNYNYKCILCDWRDGSLDVNHIDGNRRTNNHPDNLVYMCPNHHRVFTEGNLDMSLVKTKQAENRLKKTQHIHWAEYSGCEYIGEKDTYDITMQGPYHNFIAGNVVVHNCLKVRTGDPPKSVTERYCDRKNGIEPVIYDHPALEPILKDTYGLNIYQEESMFIAQRLAGFDLKEADELRKAIGKKLPKLMAEVEKKFVAGCQKVGLVNEEQAGEIFAGIKASARYQFNHSVTPDTTVELANGELKTLDELSVGDKIRCPNNDICNVVNKYEHGLQDVYEVTTESGKKIKCTMEHKFMCSDGQIKRLYEIIAEQCEIICDDGVHPVIE